MFGVLFVVDLALLPRTREEIWLSLPLAVLVVALVAGVALAVAEELRGSLTVGGLVLALVGLGGLTGGTLAQRRFGPHVDPRASNAIQLAVAALFLVPVAGLTQGFDMPLTYAALAPLVWLTLVLSIGAVLLFFWLLRRSKSGEATSFLYLVPSVTAIAAVPILGESLAPGAVAGLALALLGMRMVSAGPATPPLRRAGRRLGRLILDSAGR
jgi:drug/metabolite transporter (DMT)-like permease